MAGAGMRAKIGPTGPDGKVFASNAMLSAAKRAYERIAGPGASLSDASGDGLKAARAAALRRAPGEVKRHVAETIRSGLGKGGAEVAQAKPAQHAPATAQERVAAIQASRPAPSASPAAKPQPSLREKWYPPAETNPAFAPKAAPKFSYAEPRLQRTADARMRAQRVAYGIQARAAAEKRDLTPAERKLVASAKARAASAIASGDRARNVIAKRATAGLNRNDARRERLKAAAEQARKRGDKARAAELEKRMDATQGVKVRYSRARANEAATGKIQPKTAKPKADAAKVEAPKPVEAKVARAAKKPSTMTAGEINKEMDRLDARRSKVNQAFIAAGRGHETPNETQRKTDPLAREWNAIADRQSALRIEISHRYGPGAPSRLPTRGFGPRKDI